MSEERKVERCSDCGAECTHGYLMCDRASGDVVWCPACFDRTPCGRGEHGEECPTVVHVGGRHG